MIYYTCLSFILLHSNTPMAQQEEGWPLGLRLLNARTGLVTNGDFSGSLSFSTMLTDSPTPSSTDSSSELGTESTGSLFRDRSITLGSLIGISSFLELSRRSTRGRITMEPSKDNKKNHHKLKPWLFSLCSKLTTDAVVVRMNNDAPSLGHYLVAERRAVTTNRRNNHCKTVYGPSDFSPVQESNSLFVGDQVSALSSSSASLGEDGGRVQDRALEQSNGFGAPVIFSCLCR